MTPSSSAGLSASGSTLPVWVPSLSGQNRARLRTRKMSRNATAAIPAHCEIAPLLSDGHVSVGGTPANARASMTGFRPKDDAASPGDEGPGDAPASDTAASGTASMPHLTRGRRDAEAGFRGEKRSDATHTLTTDPDAGPHWNLRAPARCRASSDTRGWRPARA